MIDSRDTDTGIRRRRECLHCESRFTTYERPEAQTLYVTKKDERREEFDPRKLTAGVRMACAKRPLPAGAVDKLVLDVEEELRKMGRSEVHSTLVGELVMERLRSLDHIAYVRFASVYRDFADLESLRQEVETLASGGTVGTPTNQLALLPPEPAALGRGRRGRRPKSARGA